MKRNGLFAAWLAIAGCNPDSANTPEETKDAGRDAGKNTGRDAGKDAGKDAAPDAGTDAGGSRPTEAGTPGDDAGAASCIRFVMPSGVDCSPPEDGVLPKDLRCTGLYGDFDRRELACGVLEYKPAFQLWSDGAEKRRFVSLPAGKKVDASNPDAFVFPVGTLFWKEFRVQGSAGAAARMAETRLLKKTEDGWLYTSYVWTADEKQAIQMNNMTGVKDYEGTGHTIPTRDQCNECHIGRTDAILGWDALMLGPGAEGITREKLTELDLVEPGGDLELTIPGTEVERAALGYLHANCGISCHNQNIDAKGRESGLFLRLEHDELATVQTTDAYTSGMNKIPSPNAKITGLPTIEERYLAIAPGDPDRSLLVARQKQRGVEGQMPRIGTNRVDPFGVDIVTRWIGAMTVDGGYPRPID